MSVYGRLKRAYKATLPKRLRHALYVHAPFRGRRNALISWLERRAHHDEIYDADYYREIVDPYMQRSVEEIAQSIVDAFAPKTVVDLGCGTGVLLRSLGERGVVGFGFDHSAAAIELCRRRGLDVRPLDLEADAPPALRADVVVSTEVAEHLPASAADRFVDALCAISDRVVMTAAEPGTDTIGTDHVNEQPHAYWIAKLRERGYAFDEAESLAWRERWARADVANCYVRNLMLFHREAESGAAST